MFKEPNREFVREKLLKKEHLENKQDMLLQDFERGGGPFTRMIPISSQRRGVRLVFLYRSCLVSSPSIWIGGSLGKFGRLRRCERVNLDL